MSTRLTDSIQQLAIQLRAATDDQDWARLEGLDRQVNELLQRTRPMPSTLNRALAELRQAHRYAMTRATRHAEALGERLQRMQDHSEGLRAYEQMEGQP